MDDLSVHQRECLARGQVYWPPTRYTPIETVHKCLDNNNEYNPGCIRRSCYPLLSQGPCGQAQWLVLDTEGPAPAVVCRARVCPCDPAMPELCEVSSFRIIQYGVLDLILDMKILLQVEMSPGDRRETGGCQCKVALAAAQDGICQPGRGQVILSAF